MDSVVVEDAFEEASERGQRIESSNGKCASPPAEAQDVDDGAIQE